MSFKKASICQATLLPKIDAKFLLWGGGRGAHVEGVGMFLAVSFRIVNCDFFQHLSQLSLPSLNLFRGVVIISSYCVSGLNRLGMGLLKPLHRRKRSMESS